MRDISLHVLDIAMNSIEAQASLIQITILDKATTITVIIQDNGWGMNHNTLLNVVDPFYTTRKTRDVGLGLALLHQSVKATGGKFKINSIKNQGTLIKAAFKKTHIDCIPLGDINETLISLIMLAPTIDYIYTYKNSQTNYVLNTQEIKKVLKEVPINDVNVLNWLKQDLVN